MKKREFYFYLWRKFREINFVMSLSPCCKNYVKSTVALFESIYYVKVMITYVIVLSKTRSPFLRKKQHFFCQINVFNYLKKLLKSWLHRKFLASLRFDTFTAMQFFSVKSIYCSYFDDFFAKRPWHAMAVKFRNFQCGNCWNSFSLFFRKNFGKAMVLLKKLLNSRC